MKNIVKNESSLNYEIGDLETEIFLNDGGRPHGFETYDTVKGAEEYHIEGSLELDGKRVVGYDGCFECPDEVIKGLEHLGYDCEEVS